MALAAFCVARAFLYSAARTVNPAELSLSAPFLWNEIYSPRLNTVWELLVSRDCQAE